MKALALVPLVTYPDPNSKAVAANAVAIAAQLGAELHALTVNVDIPDVSNALSRFLLNLPEMIHKAEASSRKRGEELLAAVVKQASSMGVRVTTDSASAALALLGEAAAKRARYFDIVLVGWEAENTTSRAMAEAVIFGSGRPTILLPELSTVTSIDHVAVAWDGSGVAARALADARPFVEQASRLSVLTVLDEKSLQEKDAGERLADALRKRGVAAEAVPINAEDCPIAVTLQERAIELGCK